MKAAGTSPAAFRLSKRQILLTHKRVEDREPLARVPHGQTVPTELVGILRISPIAMGEEGLRPSTPPPLKRWTKLLRFGAGDLFFSKESLRRGVLAAGVKRRTKYLRFIAGAPNSF